jgi:hypothetical protein
MLALATTGISMRERRRRLQTGLLVGAMLLSGAASRPADAAASLTSTPTTIPVDDDSTPGTTPSDTVPTDTVPPEIPSPDDADGTTTMPGGLGGEEADDDNQVVGIVAVAGFALLVTAAGWWMFRRRDLDDGAQPPDGFDGGLPQQDLI